MLKRNLKGQNILEYVLLVAIIVAIFIFFLRFRGPMSKATNKVLDVHVSALENMVNALNLAY